MLHRDLMINGRKDALACEDFNGLVLFESSLSNFSFEKLHFFNTRFKWLLFNFTHILPNLHALL